MAIDPQEIAKSELADAMIPAPEDIVADLSPIAALYYLEQLGWATLTLFTAHAQEQTESNPEVADDLAVTLQEIATVVGALDASCARIGLIPPDAVPPSQGATL